VSDFISGNPEKKTWNAVYVSWGRVFKCIEFNTLSVNKWHGFVIKSFKR
jgi:hypothetical protein